MNEYNAVQVTDVSKKYCRSLKQSMVYGMRDIFSGMLGRHHDVELRNGEFYAVRNVSFTVSRGECIGIIGPNGSGKSTLLKMISGIYPPDKGEIRVKGKVGALIELGAGFHPLLTGRENIYIQAAIYNLSKKEIDRVFDDIVQFSGLIEYLDTPVKQYSTGMYIRLAFSIAIHARPEILLIDEVLAVGDAAFRMKCFSHLRQIIASGATVIVVTHNLNELIRVAKRAIVLRHGKLFYDGDVFKAIPAYMESVSHIEAEDKTANKQAWIKTIKLFDKNDKECNEFKTLDDIYMEIELILHDDITAPRLVINLLSPAIGIVFSTSNVYMHHKLKIGRHGGKVALLFKKVPLLIGAYYFNISLYGERPDEFYDLRQGAGAFRVTGPELDSLGYGINGLVKLEHEWLAREINRMNAVT
jgi:lipopolysaccharide transport system ATP-binding protein